MFVLGHEKKMLRPFTCLHRLLDKRIDPVSKLRRISDRTQVVLRARQGAASDDAGSRSTDNR